MSGRTDRPRDGASELLAAIRTVDVGRVQRALAAGADANPKSALQDSPLVAAAEAGCPEIVRILLDHGADPSPRAAVPPLVTAAERGQLAIVTMLIDAGADLDALDEHGSTALASAAHSGAREVVEQLIKAGASPSLGTPPPISAAAEEGHVAIVEILLPLVDATRHDFTADAGVVGRQEHRRRVDPLRERLSRKLLDRARDGNLAAVRKLLREGADPNAQEMGSGRTALMVALRHPEVVELLLEAGGDTSLVDDEHGMTALSHAAADGEVPSLRLLIRRGAIIETRDRSSYTPLMRACERSQVGAAKALLEAGADANAKGDRDLSAGAIVARALSACRRDVEHSRDTSIAAASEVDAVLAEVTIEHLRVLEELEETLMRGGARVELAPSSLLLAAAKEGRIEGVVRLLESGVDPNAADPWGDRALVAAIRRNDAALVETLLARGADPNLGRIGSEASPLNEAVNYGAIDVVHHLVDAGARLTTLYERRAARSTGQPKAGSTILDLLSAHGMQVWIHGTKKGDHRR